MSDELQMKVQVEVLNPVKRSVFIEVAPERVQSELEKAYQEWGQKAAVPGFRKGKIPRAVLQLHFRKEIEGQVVKDLIPEAYQEAVRGANIRPVGSPQIDDVKFESDHSLRFRVTVEIKPDLEAKDYLQIEVLKKPVEVKEEEVEQALKVIQDRASQFVPMEGWPALEGDLVYLDFEGMLNKKALKDLSGENYPVILGSHALLPELEMAVLGMTKDQVKEIQVPLPADFIKKDLAGKRILFRLRVREIKKKRIPELNNDFPKEIGEEGTLEDLKEKLRKELLLEKEKERDNTLKDEILEKVLEANLFEAPSSMVEEELEHMMESTRRSLSARRATLKDLDLDEEGLRERLRDQATKRVKSSLILEAVALKEKVEPSEEEIQRELENLSASLQQDAAALRNYFQEKDGLAQVKGILRERKTVDFLFEHANVISGDRIVLT